MKKNNDSKNQPSVTMTPPPKNRGVISHQKTHIFS